MGGERSAMNQKQTSQQNGKMGARTEQRAGEPRAHGKGLDIQISGLPKREGRKRSRDGS